ncbi:hypothetical protein COCVIDRAFT_98107, partial [Bipolaris victoriae FI3]
FFPSIDKKTYELGELIMFFASVWRNNVLFFSSRSSFSSYSIKRDYRCEIGNV